MTEPETWCTNWTAYDVPRLWEMVSTEDSREAWAQVSAWFRLRDAVDDQRERLAACRQALVELWPPERSEASAAFVAVLDELVNSMTATVQAATSTATGLAGVLESLATAKAEIKPLYDEWRVKASDLTPRWFDHAEDDLNEQARDAMIKAETAVAQYAEMIEPPPAYEMELRRDPEVLVEFGAQSNATSWSKSAALGVPHDPPPPMPGLKSIDPNAPILAGGFVSTPSAVAPPQLPVPLGPPGNTPGGSTPPAPPSAPIAWLLPTLRSPALPPGTVIGPTLLPPSPPTPTRAAAPNATANGLATRGAVPAVVAPSAPPPTGAMPSRQAAAATGASRSGQTPRHVPSLAGTGYRTPDGHVVTVKGLDVRLGDSPQRQPADLHDPWVAGEGLPPVIAPGAPRQHDPGPGIIGLDR